MEQENKVVLWIRRALDEFVKNNIETIDKL